MGNNHRGILLKLLVAFGFSQVALARVGVEMYFQMYSDSCREDLSTSACDPKFAYCLDRPRDTFDISPCYYKSTDQSGYFQNTNYIDMSSLSSIRGLPNPWMVSINQLLDRSIRLLVRVRDDDTFDDDTIAYLGITLTETIYPSQSSAVWADRQMWGDSALLTFKVRMYCEANYYSADCSVYCLAIDRAAGHYTCDPKTGSKICIKGWTGQNCAEDIDECVQDYCQRGRCENFPGDYVCYCPFDYTGKNCTVRVYPCDSNPCSNNATCSNAEGMNYTCSCVGDWEGGLCDVKLNPCKARPCQNQMNCIPSDDHSNYTCNCLYPTTGVDCEAFIPGYTTTTTIEETTMREENYTQPQQQYHAQGPSNESGFKYWYAIVIPILVLIIIAVIVICLVARWRRRKQNDINARQELNPDRLAFENNAYNGIREGYLEVADKNKQRPKLLSPSTENDKLSSVKPVFIDMNSATSDKGDNKKSDDCVDEHGYVKPSNVAKSRSYENMIERLMGNEHAVKNPYSSFRSPSSTMETQPSEEAHYQDLDEVAESLKTIDDMAEDDDESSESLKSSDDSSEENEPVPSLTVDDALPFDNPATNQPAANWNSDSGIYQSPRSTPAQKKPVVPPKPAHNGSEITPSAQIDQPITYQSNC